MAKPSTALSTFAFGLLLMSCSSPPVVSTHSQAVHSETYVDSDFIWQLAFPPPPAADSELQRAEQATVEDWRDRRSEEDCRRAQQQHFVDFRLLWGEQSPFVEPLPAELSALFERLDQELGQATRALKDHYQRPRPAAELSCNASGKSAKSFAYPSGHAAFSRLFALVLAELVPARREEFLQRADAIALDRVISGVHFPSDIEAGKLLAEAYYEELSTSPKYQQELEQLRKLVVSSAD
ncbi:MAG: phosphatase PAP2 family protein [Myxococcota bacterium]|jgi:hypothetical protein|nr:phosphatase PAP2 family protein [Myxococcota bacterium]